MLINEPRLYIKPMQCVHANMSTVIKLIKNMHLLFPYIQYKLFDIKEGVLRIDEKQLPIIYVRCSVFLINYVLFIYNDKCINILIHYSNRIITRKSCSLLSPSTTRCPDD